MDFKYYLDPITKHYFDFEGVAGRRAYWMFALYTSLVSLALIIVLSVIHQRQFHVLYDLATLLPGLGLGARRLHDISKSAWWLLVVLVPVLGAIYLIYLYCQPSTTPYGAAT